MAIGLNYTHIDLGDDRHILPSYLFLLGEEFWPANLASPEAKERLHEMLVSQEFRKILEDAQQQDKFDDPLIWELLLAAYPYEIELKCLGRTVSNELDRNETLIGLFNEFFAIDYQDVLDEYERECNRAERYEVSLSVQDCLFVSWVEATDVFVNYVVKLLQSEGYAAEATAYQAYAQTKLHISFEDGITGVTTEIDDEVYITIGNMSCTTLFHELAHFTNRFFRFHYYHNYGVCFDNYTKTNEGFAEFVGYHLHHQIMHGDIEAIQTVSTDPLFFSAYIDVYATLRKHGSNDRKHNFDIVFSQMQRFDRRGFTEKRAHFYFERFYKFFHYDQHEYFYPKELMYYLGYESIRKLFAHASNKKQLLVQLFLGRVCV